ncbi:MoaD/ThiS family protein [Burkholderia stagnalis]|uniref:MoaD/ThiS family protein n=1 Tax=Burkholderia stagnalis TaxID=1503054 RepID=A0A6L3MWA6_9BURK|nr:MoaD/ThiS family protein [Burkholderia stagnalis]KAB0637049.1 MoaD/ThiS family protein [Burkholderia stagnalis]KWH67477.1 hypothetical protein WT64_23555 [Burkholderia stagnalis]VWB34360.1 hypothetical protein BST28156_01526 [Burkholderia stagnalis]
MPTLILSAQLAALANGQLQLERDEQSIDEICRGLTAAYPALTAAILDAHGRISPFVGVFVDGGQIDPAADRHMALPRTSVVTLISAVAGG